MGIQSCLHLDRRTVSTTRFVSYSHEADSPSHRNAHYPPHKHSGVTTHLILNSSLTYTYPDDPDATKETLGVGGRWDVDANKVHEVWVGKEGCTYVIGE